MSEIVFIGGHSNKKVGARGQGYKEEIIARRIADKCVKKFNETYFASAVTDNVNQHSGGGEEDFVIASKPKYFMSLHLNASDNASALGSEIIVNNKEKTTGIEDKILSEMVKLGFKNRGIKRRSNDGWETKTNSKVDYYGILRTLMSKGIHGTIFEIAFITNKSDMDRLLANEDKIVKIIVEAIGDGFGYKRRNIPEDNSKPSTSQPEPESDTLYRVCIGTFRNLQNARKTEAEAIAKGFEAFIVNK